jgi:hypothetical protein
VTVWDTELGKGVTEEKEEEENTQFIEEEEKDEGRVELQ